MTARTGLQCKAVGNAQSARSRPEGGAQDHRLRQVFALHLTGRNGTHGEVPGFGIEQAREHAARVKARRAPPIDRAAGGDQRRRVTVAQQRVIGNWTAHDAALEAISMSSAQRIRAAASSPSPRSSWMKVLPLKRSLTIGARMCTRPRLFASASGQAAPTRARRGRAPDRAAARGPSPVARSRPGCIFGKSRLARL